MKKQLMLLIPVIGIATICHAQTFSPNVISSAGGTNDANNVSLDWTVGESSVQTVSTNENIVTQGLHQSNIQVLEIQNEDASLEGIYTISVAPNPVNDILTTSIQSQKDSKLLLTVVDLNGNNILKEKMHTGEDSKTIDMSGFATGVYFLHVKDEAGKLIKTFKIIKL